MISESREDLILLGEIELKKRISVFPNGANENVGRTRPV
jgi:hypothetical protein